MAKIFVSLLVVLLSLSVVLVFCEYLVYFIALYWCSWPQLEKNFTKDELKVAFLADTHLLGVRKGHWFDKLRREWQMYRSFQTLMVLHEPNIVFILGDIFDEASFSPDDVYMSYVRRFFQLFNTTKKTELFVVPGNHDIGFHYAMHPYLEYRFSETLKAPSVRMLTRRNTHFILINSMALEGDGCSICSKAEHDILRLRIPSYAIYLTHKKYSCAYTFIRPQCGDKLRCFNGTATCSQAIKKHQYSRPILLLHFPLFRKSDVECDGSAYFVEPDFKEKWDCLSKDATNFLLDELQPKVIFTGHTHKPCRRLHKNNAEEFTVPSFNWRNTPRPSFIMAVFAGDQYSVCDCHLPSEYSVIGVYLVFILVIVFLICFRFWHIRIFWKKKTQ